MADQSTQNDMRSQAPRSRLRVIIRGAVQGVGFRPFVYRLARELDLPGWVNNTSQGVFVEVEGSPDLVQSFLLRLPAEIPPRAFIQSLEHVLLEPVGYSDFEIRHSDESGPKTTLVLPDIASCPDCLADIRSPNNRRYRYPFTNCTNCGPRFSIIQALPYDRGHTTMARFQMCEACQAEYDNPLDRRFHAQPNACPVCGPQLALWDTNGRALAMRDDALKAAERAIQSGQIVAVKGLGGFHLMADARNAQAVMRLRARKQREEKPFALMAPSLQAAQELCAVSALETRLLLSPEAPIVLLKRHALAQGQVAFSAVAPGNPYLGVMLPYTPLHHLLMADLGFAVVATSGNRSDEPICTDEWEALTRLEDIADLFLVHDRPIARHVDDSIARIMAGREILLRRARGYAPLPITLEAPVAVPVLAVGAHLKNTIAVAAGRDVAVSQHIGDLETEAATLAFRQVIADLSSLYALRPALVVHDLHPDYRSTHEALSLAARLEVPTMAVQHHWAHMLACMAENAIPLNAPVLGVSWDGTGYGIDGTIWGGEFLAADGSRVAHLRTFRLPGSEHAVKEPARVALSLLFELFGNEISEYPPPPALAHLASVKWFAPRERRIIARMLAQNLNAPLTSSAGRLFDGFAALIGLRQKVGYEGQAAMDLEFALEGSQPDTQSPYAFRLHGAGGQGPYVLDWELMARGVVADVNRGEAISTISARFHNTLTDMIVAVATQVGHEHVTLTGGCFQNRYLLEHTVERLRIAGFKPHWHQRLPPTDGGIAAGQIVAAASRASGT